MRLKHYFKLVLLIIPFFSCSLSTENKYFDNGNLKLKCELKDGKRNGKCTGYFENGNLKSVSSWKNGLAEGVTDYYDTDGNLIEKTHWKEGKASGKSEEYYSNGVLKETGFFRNDEAEGWCSYFQEDGSLWKKREYVIVKGKGVLNQWIIFDQDGEVIEEQSEYYKILPGRDTILSDEPYKMRVQVVTPYNDRIELLTGDYDEEYNLKDKQSWVVTKLSGKEGEYIVEKPLKGQNVIRGLVNTYNEIGTDTFQGRGIYFEKYFYVK